MQAFSLYTLSLRRRLAQLAGPTPLAVAVLAGAGGMALWPVAVGAKYRTPDHVVVLIEEDQAVNAVGDPQLPYFNQLANTGLVYTNSHGIGAPAQTGQLDYLALYSGSTLGVTDNFPGYSFSGPNLAQSLNFAGRSFAGFSEDLPANGSQAQMASNAADAGVHPDLYFRAYNPMAQFTDLGPNLTNADVNKTFASFPTTAAGYAALPTVSFVIPDSLHNTHGSNNAEPFAADPASYESLRQAADQWLQGNLGAYVDWARTHNSLLIVTTDEEDRMFPASGLTTIVNGDPSLYVSGTSAQSITHYDVLRTLEQMYGLPLLGETTNAAGLAATPDGRLAATPAAAAVPLPSGLALGAAAAPLLLAARRLRKQAVSAGRVPEGVAARG